MSPLTEEDWAELRRQERIRHQAQRPSEALSDWEAAAILLAFLAGLGAVFWALTRG